MSAAAAARRGVLEVSWNVCIPGID